MLRVPSSIEKVTVYRQGAMVHRRVPVTATDGALAEQIVVADLPLALTDASVRVWVVSAEGEGDDLVVASVNVGLFVAPLDTLPKAPDDVAIRRIARVIEKRRAELDDLETKADLLAQLRVPPRPSGKEGKPPPRSPLGARVMLEALVDEALRARDERGRAIVDELDRLEKELAELEARRDEASSARRISEREITKKVTVKLRGAAKKTSAVLRLDYHVRGARWAPAYQVRLAQDATEAEIVQRALVCQRTGEDWRGVRLALSTAQPMTWTELPELSALRIGKRQTPPLAKRGYRAPPAGASQLYADYDLARSELARLVPAPDYFAQPSVAIARPELAAATFGGGGVGASQGMPSAAMSMAREEAFDEVAALDDEHEEGAATMPPPSVRMMRSAPAPKMAKKRRAYAAAELAPPAAVAEAVVYPELVLGDPSDPQTRGRLTPRDRRRQYVESIETKGRVLELDVLRVVEEATRRAQSAQDAALPPSATDVGRASGAFDYTYDADAAVDVASDGVFHSVPIGARKSPCEVRYVVVPREDTNVFRIAQIENPLFAPLLAGPAELYVGGEYVLTTAIDTVPPRGALTLGLGVEQAIRCARNARYSEKRTSDKVVATNELVHDISIELVNNLPRAVQCEVRERIPQPADDAEVVVEEVDVTPPWSPYDQEERGVVVLGGRRWQVTVDAGAEVSLTARYVVKIYANNEIVGGNRREA